MGHIWLLLVLLNQQPVVKPTTTATVIQSVKAAYSAQKRATVVFDIDGVLLDSRGRTAHILANFADSELKAKNPVAALQISNLNISQITPVLIQTLQRAGIAEPSTLNSISVFWGEMFYKEDMFKHDILTPKSAEYIQLLHSSGARIVYIGSRDAPRQLGGTIRKLQSAGLPIGVLGTEIILKPTAQMQDPIYRQQLITYLNQTGTPVALFEGEAQNASVYQKAFPNASVFLYMPRAAGVVGFTVPQNVIPFSAFTDGY